MVEKKKKERLTIKQKGNRLQIYKICPKCNTQIKVSKRKEEIYGTPYYTWGWKGRIECPRCETDFAFNGMSFPLPTKVKTNIPDVIKPVKQDNQVLFACDVGLGTLDKAIKNLDKLRNEVREKRYSYIAVLKDYVQFLEEIHPARWNPDYHCSDDGWCNVYTNIDFNGNVETGIDTWNCPDETQLEKRKPEKIEDGETLNAWLKKNIFTCDECVNDPLIKKKRNNETLCLFCGKPLCNFHMNLHLKYEHYIKVDEEILDLEKT